MAMKIRPLNDRVVVQRLEEEAKSAGGIIIPPTAAEKPTEGVVMAVGPGKVDNGQRIEPCVKVGDKVLFGKYAGTEIELDGKQVVVMREEDILAVLEGAK
jgi:chaperonin GroES